MSEWVLPDFVAHADWSVQPKKRWLVQAERRPDGGYHIAFPRPLRRPMDLLDPLFYSRKRRPEATIFLGLDVPLGLPLAYADQVGCREFVPFLRQLGTGEWAAFFEPAAEADEIGLKRPFYPLRPGNTRQQHLLDGLNVGSMDALRRRCERATAERRAAAPLFWTMGAQQVGKAALSVWHEMLQPGLAQRRRPMALWPFDGELKELLATYPLVVAEAYPAEFYGHLGVAFPRQSGGKSGKRTQAGRWANAAVLLGWAERQGVTLDGPLRFLIEDGFGAFPYGEDRFDAAVGVMGMLNILLGQRPVGEPEDEVVRRVEGAILGTAATASG